MSQQQGRRHPKRPPSPKQTEYDLALIKAKTEDKQVDVVLALPTPYTDADGNFTGRVIKVDTFAVQFDIVQNGHGLLPWISKAFIVSAHVR